jgi:predicted dehydrogenase/nucleoside-diphosphate-sugar epimerase
MTRRPLRVAFIGAGQMAHQHLRAATRAASATVVGVHDRAAAQAEAFAAAAGTRAFPSIDALMTEARPDVVHVCTPPGAHFDAAYAALEGGAHVYVEKPFALTVRDARALLDLASARDLIVCAGHQLLRDPAFETLMARGAGLGPLVQADSHFAFRPASLRAARGDPRAQAEQVIDILPHPLYSLVAVLERFTPAFTPIDLAWVDAGPADLHAALRAGDLVGRLSVSLRARPVASSLTLIGARGSVTCDFVRSIVVGTENAGTEALEKVLNPFVEGAQVISRTAWSLARRVLSGVPYPGLVPLIAAFHRAVAEGAPSPVSPAHLLRVTALFETLVDALQAETRRSKPVTAGARPGGTAPVTVVTGAGGFLGAEIARALPRVRGVGRGANPEDPNVQEWVRADLSCGLAAEALAGAPVVVHAAAETVGSYGAHQRNTIDATRNLLHAMHAAGCSRLVLVSSLSVLRPPRTPWERQDERTPRPKDPARLGSYVWGKCLQEELVEREAPALGIATRVIRPGALLDGREPALPGLMGRRLFGRWHLALGRPGLPMAVCDVERCAEAIAWCATHFDEAPPVVNLFDPEVTTRGGLVARLQSHGWKSRIVWVPINVVAPGLLAARALHSLLRRRLPERLATWATYLRPRRYDARLTAALLEAARREARPLPSADVAVHV